VSRCSELSLPLRCESSPVRCNRRWVNEEGIPAPRAHNNLPESLDYESLENDVYRGEHYHHPTRRHFYGCVLSPAPHTVGSPIDDFERIRRTASLLHTGDQRSDRWARCDGGV
jgi:hypothetical protein